MPFIRSQGQNAGFQKGWNMIMSLYGQKQIAERTEAQQKQFDEQMGMREKQFKLQTDEYAQESKVREARLRELEAKNTERQTELKARHGFQKAKRAGMLSGKWGKEEQRSAFRDYEMAVGELEESSFDAPKETKAETRTAQQLITQANQANQAKLSQQTGMSRAHIIRRANDGDPKAQAVLVALQKYDEDVARIRATVTTPTDRRIAKAQALARAELGHLDEAGAPLINKDMAKLATGPYANLKAFWDALAGGVGLDALVGKDGLYKSTQAARQMMATFKNSVMDALKFSRMGAGYDIKRITGMIPDPKKLIINPTNEANKIDTLRAYLKVVRRSNLEGITTAVSATEIDKLTNANQKINTILAQIGTDEPAAGLSPQAQDWLKKRGY